MSLNLFDGAEQNRIWYEKLCPGAMVVRHFALPYETAIFVALPASWPAGTPIFRWVGLAATIIVGVACYAFWRVD
ncbi:MAG: hypothetical protein H7240_09150 [Glaciimonas sp.]|nr:hypothetical protein [Glaciimonas sp.]